MMQVRQLKLQAEAPAEVPPHSMTRGLSHSTGLAVLQHLLTVYRRADNTEINRAIISIIHVCSDVPRPKAASHVAHDFTLSQSLSFLLCSPQTQFSFIPWICKKLQGTCRKIQTVLEICLSVMEDSPELFRYFLNMARHLECAKKGGNQLPDSSYFCTERAGHGLKHHRVLTVLEQPVNNYLGNATGEGANVKCTQRKVTLPFFKHLLARGCLTLMASSTCALLSWMAIFPPKYFLLRNATKPFGGLCSYCHRITDPFPQYSSNTK